jgi:sugar lactone lactonase YvrE
MNLDLLLDIRLDLGEGPAWDSQAGILSFVDIRAGDLHLFHPATASHQMFNLDEPVGCAAPSSTGEFILGLRSGIWTFNPSTQTLTQILRPENIPGNRFNDGKCDPRGRFLAGTMDNAEKENTGSLYSYSPDGSYKTLLTGLGISNGLTWSPDHKTFYFIDTPTRLVMAYDYDLNTGDISNPRPVVHVPADMGWPDGMTSDMDGMLWVAMWGGAKLTKWNPATGQLVEAYPLPALNVSACCFGGANLTDLYVTSARKGMSAAQLEEYPLSGGLFRFQPGVRGMPTFVFDATVLK